MMAYGSGIVASLAFARNRGSLVSTTVWDASHRVSDSPSPRGSHGVQAAQPCAAEQRVTCARCGAQRHHCPSAHTLCTTLFSRSDGRSRAMCSFSSFLYQAALKTTCDGRRLF